MSRILQTRVPPLIPPAGPIHAALFGEAPGPRGADQSGIPFWGDRAGIQVYRALETAGLARVPAAAYDHWDGAHFRESGLVPELNGVVLGNAFPYCPSRDLQTFRAPTDAELRHPDNLARLGGVLAMARERCPGQLRVIALGKRALWVLERLGGGTDFPLHGLPHPSALGLLQAARSRGKGVKMADLQREWEARLVALLQA